MNISNKFYLVCLVISDRKSSDPVKGFFSEFCLKMRNLSYTQYQHIIYKIQYLCAVELLIVTVMITISYYKKVFINTELS